MKEQNIKTIIFDFDGTLADTFSLVVEIALKLNEVLKLFKKEEVNIEDFRNISSSDFLKRLAMPKYKLLYYFWQGKKLFGENIDKVNLFPGIEEMLKELKRRNIKLAIVSINSKKTIEKFLEKKNIKYFDYVESPLIAFNKVKSLKKVMNNLNSQPEETLYVGDETRDIEAAKKADIKSVAVVWGYHFRELLVRYDPNYTIDTPEELLEII